MVMVGVEANLDHKPHRLLLRYLQKKKKKVDWAGPEGVESRVGLINIGL